MWPPHPSIMIYELQLILKQSDLAWKTLAQILQVTFILYNIM